MTFWTSLLGQSFAIAQLDAGGTNTRAMTTGSGEPVIFLHGISGHLETFVPVVPHFGGRYELHLIDMLGHGYTDKPGIDLTADVLADHVIAYMDARGIAKAHIVGLSLGGWVAGWLSAQYPDRILSTILVASAGNLAMARPDVGEMIRKSTMAGVMSDDREDTKSRLQRVLHHPELVDDEMVDVRFGVYHMPEFRAGIEGLLALTDVDTYMRYALTPEVLNKVRGEVLIVWGEDDQFSGVADADFLVGGLAKAKVVQMNDTGHWPPYERPADFARIATAFFEQGLAGVEAGRQ